MELPNVQTNIDANNNIINGFHGEEAVIVPRLILLSFIRHIFKNIKNPNYKYEEDISITKIRIEDSNNIDLEKINFWPAITVARSAVSFSNMFIGDRGGNNNSTNLGALMNLNANVGADIVTGMLSVNLYSSNAYEAEILMWLVAIMIKTGSKTLRKAGFHDLFNEKITPPMIIGSESNLYMVTLTVRYALSIQWIENRILKNIYEGCVKIDLDFIANDGAGECKPGIPKKEKEEGG